MWGDSSVRAFPLQRRLGIAPQSLVVLTEDKYYCNNSSQMECFESRCLAALVVAREALCGKEREGGKEGEVYRRAGLCCFSLLWLP